ncbi:hypothetical protein QM787_16635 [Rhodococcus ruber]|uniref:Uncharacterized protein n=1 Tax=Rhodococcus ruber TaxID=1830 RepID=A0A098BVG5_9NOCA|nr:MULTISPECIES: hypothetical protein [Rhodococcus]MCD2129232.1 hypothetical protein [Rhodococcus ruber]MCZ4504981.1 hypothetical protein [Rhodococcus ruber]MCZ4531586.1 hypothetical protein [Rhodococcus ruber]MCZ4622397.1 hypothetical protein [Rhodococcus ruber]MDI9971366.1 hypothetical protein [Rhodococcus ruber]
MSPADVGDVVRRWNPDGWARLHAPSGPPRVRVAGVDGCGCAALVDELSALDAAPEYVRDGRATVVLTVFEASAYLGRTELAVLESAGRGAGRVVCALTGIDAHPDWREVHERDVALLQRHAPWLGPVTLLPVGTSLAARARVVGGDAGAVLRLESGIVDLHEALTAALVAGPHTDRALRTAVVAETRHLVARAAAELRAGDDTAALRAERARWSLRASTPADDGGLRAELQRARLDTAQAVSAAVRAASAEVRDALESVDPARVPDLLGDAVRDLYVRVDAVVTARLARIGPAEQRPDGPPVAPPRLAPPSPRRSVEDRLTVVIGASAAAGLGRVAVSPLSLVPGLELATVPLSLLLGAAAAWWLVRIRRRLAERDRMRRWALEELVDVRAELEAVALERIVDAEARLGAAVAAGRAARIAAARERIAAVDDELRRRAEDRAGKLAACERDLAVLARAGTGGRAGASNAMTASDGVTRE